MLLVLSWIFARITPYQTWYDIIFDAINYAFTTIATWGFAPYDTSVGLSTMHDGVLLIQWLQNPLSEWIIAFFMMFSAINLWLWYEWIFLKNWKIMFRNKELKVFLVWVLLLTWGIVYTWISHDTSLLFGDVLRWAFFSMTSIVSTTGLANYDFSLWPASAIWLLLVVYFTGSCVWSTSGGIKLLRLVVLAKYAFYQIKNLVNNEPMHKIKIDGVEYSVEAASIILLNIIMYFFFFIVGGILIMGVNPMITLLDGTQIANNFTTAFGASIANLWNIGPIPSIDGVNLGPSGNYAVLNTSAKLILSLCWCC
jgi:trk system potassium uptake protein TrkH